MPEDNQKTDMDESAADSQKADSSKKSKEKTDKSSEAEKESKSLDLETLKNTKATKAPKSTIAGTVRPRAVKDPGPKMDWKFSIIACIACMFFAMTTHIFGINGGLVLNDKFNLAFLMSKTLIGDVSEKILMDMLGVAPLSQPWLKASLIADHSEYGFTFIWYHVINVFWHAIATGFLFFFILTMARHLHHQKRLKLSPYYLATATAALFACHPFTCEAVTYMSSRSALLATLNFFQSLVFLLAACLLQQPLARICFALLALYTGAMSIWASPEAVTLPAVALLSLFLLKRPLAQWQQTVQEHPIFVGATGALSVAIPFLTLLPMQHTTAINLMLPTLSPVSYAASQLKAFVFYYLRCFCLPVGLSIDPPLALAGSFTDPFVLAAAAILVILVFAFVKIRQPILGLAGVFVLAGFLPHALMLQPDTVADWVAYLPLSGMMLFAACGLCHFAHRNLKGATILFSALALSFFALSIYRDWQWGSNYTLFQSGLSLRPKSAFLHANLALEYLKREQVDDAEKEAKLALIYGPQLALAQIARAKVQLAQDKYDDASKGFAACLKLAEAQKLASEVKTECRLGELQCLIGQHKQEEANSLLTKLSTELPGDESRLMYLVGMAAFQMHNYEQAFKLLDRAVSSNPSLTECWQPMAECALYLRANDAAYQAAHACMDMVGGANANLLFARSAIISKRESEAEEILKPMLQTEPKDARVPYLLSRLYKRNGKAEEWKKYREAAIKIDPEVAVKFALPELDADEAATPEQPAGTEKESKPSNPPEKAAPAPQQAAPGSEPKSTTTPAPQESGSETKETGSQSK